MGTAAGVGLSGQEDARALEVATVKEKCKKAAGWLIFIAAVSAINSVLSAFHVEWSFFIGLGVTLLIDYVASTAGPAAVYVGLLVNVLIAAVFVVLWQFGRKGDTWAFVTGSVLYFVDLVILTLLTAAGGWDGTLVKMIIFHLVALAFIVSGVVHARKLKKLRAAMETVVPGTLSSSATAQ